MMMWDTYLVLCFGFRWLKRASQNGNLDILKLFWHLRMAHVLVNDNAVHQFSVLKLAANFAIHLQAS